jgi:uncharacterized repeat protein (TIGR02543 family)
MKTNTKLPLFLATLVVLAACGTSEGSSLLSSDSTTAPSVLSSSNGTSLVTSTGTTSTSTIVSSVGSSSTSQSTSTSFSSESSSASSTSETPLIAVTVIFVTNGGTAIDTITFTNPNQVTIPTTTRVGFDFQGWFLDENLAESFAIENYAMPTENTTITLYAKWLVTVATIQFVDSLGLSYAPITGNVGDTVTLPTPIETHYTFSGWFMDASYQTPATLTALPNDMITVYGLWTANAYTIEYMVVDPIQKISGYDSNGYVTASGDLYVTGYNGWNLLGVNFNGQFATTPILVNPFLNLGEGEKVAQVEFTSTNQIVLTTFGRVLIVGANHLGQYLDPSLPADGVFVDITNKFPLTVGEKITNLYANFLSLGLSTSLNQLYLWSYNEQNQVGVTDDGSGFVSTPIHVNPLLNLLEGETLKHIMVGKHSTNLLTNTGRLFGAGVNNEKQAGIVDNVYSSLFVEVTEGFNLNENEWIVRIEYGTQQGYALTNQSRFIVWGANWTGQLGKGNLSYSAPFETTPLFNLNEGEVIVDFAGGDEHAVILTSQQRLFTFGHNWSGTLGNDSWEISSLPIDVTSFLTLAPGETIVDVDALIFTSFAYTSTGRILSWGQNRSYLYHEDNQVNHRVPTTMFNAISSQLKTEEVAYQTAVTLWEPESTYGQFTGWFLDAALTQPYVASTMPGNTLTLYTRFQ